MDNMNEICLFKSVFRENKRCNTKIAGGNEMKNKKRLLICGLIMGLVIASISVSAANPRAAADCKATIYMYQTNAIFEVFETTSPMNPVTPKQIVGTYKSENILGQYNIKDVTGSINYGQLSITKTAPDNYQSVYGEMEYRLNGRYAGWIEKYY